MQKDDPEASNLKRNAALDALHPSGTVTQATGSSDEIQSDSQ